MQNPGKTQVEIAIEAVVANDHGRLLAGLIRQFRDFQLAEDALQDAIASALEHWRRSGLPANPQGWLVQVARRKAMDRLRRDQVLSRKLMGEAALANPEQEEVQEFPDDRLRLIFTCCHPALAPKTRVALTLRTLGGLTTEEIASAFLDRPAAMGQRLSRAKTKIRDAGIPFAIPQGPERAERLQSVLEVIYLIFNEGYSASDDGSPIRTALCEEAIFLSQMVCKLSPDDAEARGLLALLLLTHARHSARSTPLGMSIPVESQDRGLWSQSLITEGMKHLDGALQLNDPGPFQIKAAIAALHSDAGAKAPDWRQIVLLYDSLLFHEPSAVIRLNRAVALSELAGPEAGLRALTPLADELENYQPFHAAHAFMLGATGACHRARIAFRRAIELSGNEGDILFLRDAMNGLEPGSEKEKSRAQGPAKSNREV